MIRSVSVLYREPKVLKAIEPNRLTLDTFVSVLYREPKVLKADRVCLRCCWWLVSVLYREPKVLKADVFVLLQSNKRDVSVLYREPKVLKASSGTPDVLPRSRFSALP